MWGEGFGFVGWGLPSPPPSAVTPTSIPAGETLQAPARRVVIDVEARATALTIPARRTTLEAS